MYVDGYIFFYSDENISFLKIEGKVFLVDFMGFYITPAPRCKYINEKTITFWFCKHNLN